MNSKSRVERQRQIAKKRHLRSWKARGFVPVLWKAQVANYLASDYSQGLWTPLFPEIYSQDTSTWTENHLFGRLVKTFGAMDQWAPEATALAAWCSTSTEVALAFYRQALALLQQARVKNPQQEAWEPHQGVLWEFLHPLKKQLIEE